MSAAANFLPAERRGEPPERYSKAPLVQVSGGACMFIDGIPPISTLEQACLPGCRRFETRPRQLLRSNPALRSCGPVAEPRVAIVHGVVPALVHLRLRARGRPPRPGNGSLTGHSSCLPSPQAAYLLADACLRPALLGHQLIACLAAGEQQAQQLSMEPQAEPQHLAHLAATWESREPLHVLLAQLEVSGAAAGRRMRWFVLGLTGPCTRGAPRALPPTPPAGAHLALTCAIGELPMNGHSLRSPYTPCSSLLLRRAPHATPQGVSEADAEDAVRPLVNSLMRSEARVLAEAAPPGRLEGPALLRLL